MKRVLSVAAAGLAAALLASCGSDVDVCTNPGGECPPPRDFDVTFGVETPERFGALQFDITHLGDSGGFIGAGDKVECEALVDAITVANYQGERTTKVGLISLTGITTPANILRCGFRTAEDLKPSDFRVEVTDASDTESAAIKPVPDVVVSSIVERGTE